MSCCLDICCINWFSSFCLQETSSCQTCSPSLAYVNCCQDICCSHWFSISCLQETSFCQTCSPSLIYKILFWWTSNILFPTTIIDDNKIQKCIILGFSFTTYMLFLFMVTGIFIHFHGYMNIHSFSCKPLDLTTNEYCCHEISSLDREIHDDKKLSSVTSLIIFGNLLNYFVLFSFHRGV